MREQIEQFFSLAKEREQIEQFLNLANERQMRIIYQFIKAVMEKD